MKKNFKLVALAMFSVAVLASCDKTETPNDPTIGTDDVVLAPELLKGAYTTSIRLEEGKTYKLDGGVHMKKGTTLFIEPGVTIVAQADENNEDYILIEQGAKIEAEGTKSEPILMTSTLKQAGAWGGIHICGYAYLNEPDAATTKTSEIGDSPYGGTVDNDNSGTLRYIVLEYTGEIIAPEKEANGISFYGVGSGTTVEYCQAYRGADDGFEFFGGSVNVRYMVVTSCSDDSFDWTGGWRGKGQFLVAYQESEATLGYTCDKMIEADNDKTTADKGDERGTASFPTLANITLVSENNNVDAEATRGIRLRAGTKVKLYNTIVKGKDNDITVETTRTENSLKSGESILDYITIGTALSSKENIYTNADFIANTNNKVENVSLTNNFVGTVAGGKDVSAVDSWFIKAEYKGAISASNNWTEGWIIE